MALTKIGNRYYTLHDTGVTKAKADKMVSFLRNNTKYNYFRKVKTSYGRYSVYKGV